MTRARVNQQIKPKRWHCLPWVAKVNYRDMQISLLSMRWSIYFGRMRDDWGNWNTGVAFCITELSGTGVGANAFRGWAPDSLDTPQDLCGVSGAHPQGSRCRICLFSQLISSLIIVLYFHVVILLQVCLAYFLIQSIQSSLAPFASFNEHLGIFCHGCRRSERRSYRMIRLATLRLDSQRCLF